MPFHPELNEDIVDKAGRPDPRSDGEHSRPVKIKIIIQNGFVTPRISQRQIVDAG